MDPVHLPFDKQRRVADPLVATKPLKYNIWVIRKTKLWQWKNNKVFNDYFKPTKCLLIVIFSHRKLLGVWTLYLIRKLRFSMHKCSYLLQEKEQTEFVLCSLVHDIFPLVGWVSLGQLKVSFFGGKLPFPSKLILTRNRKTEKMNSRIRKNKKS